MKEHVLRNYLLHFHLPFLQTLHGSFMRPIIGALDGVLKGELLLLLDADEVVSLAAPLRPSIVPGLTEP